MYFFFFKQKTAYEMRISDWISDVCSSDLIIALARPLIDGGVGGDRHDLAAHRSVDRRIISGHVDPRLLLGADEGDVFRGDLGLDRQIVQIGRASCRERVGTNV